MAAGVSAGVASVAVAIGGLLGIYGRIQSDFDSRDRAQQRGQH